MKEETEQIDEAIQAFLEAIDENDLENLEIRFQKKTDNAKRRKICRWERNPITQQIEWTCSS